MLLGMAVLLATAGCGAAVAPVPTPSGPRPCRGADLVAVWAGTSALTGGQLASSLVLGNRGASACALAGFPALQLLGLSGDPLAIPVRDCRDEEDCRPDRVVVVQPRTARFDPHQRTPGQAYFFMTWHIHRPDPGTEPCPPSLPAVAKVQVRLPAGRESLTVPVPLEAEAAEGQPGAGLLAVRSDADLLSLAGCTGDLTIFPFAPT